MRIDSDLGWPLFLLSATYWRLRRQGNRHRQSLAWLQFIHGLPLALWALVLYRILVPTLKLPRLGKLPFSLLMLPGYWPVASLCLIIYIMLS